MQSHLIRHAVQIVIVGALYSASAALGRAAGLESHPELHCWLPAGVSIASVLLAGRSAWRGIVLGAVVTGYLRGDPLPVVVGMAAGDALAAIAGLFVLERADFRSSLSRLRDVVLLGALGGWATTYIAAALVVLGGVVGGTIDASSASEIWLRIWFSYALGVLIVAPPLLVWAPGDRIKERSMLSIEGIGLWASLAFGCSLVFGSPLRLGGFIAPTQFVLEPLLLWAAVRFGMRGATLVVLGLWAAAMNGTSHGLGPFGALGLDLAVPHILTLVGVSMAVNLVLSSTLGERLAVAQELRSEREDLERKVDARTQALLDANLKLQVEIEEREGTEEKLRDSQRAADRIAETTPSVLAVYDIAESRFTYANKSTERVLGMSPEQLCELSLDDLKTRVHPEDADSLPEAVNSLLGAEPDAIVEKELRLRTDSAGYRWLSARCSVLGRDSTSSPRQLLATIVDVTASKRVEENLAAANRRALEEYERLLGRIAQLAQTLGTARDLHSIYCGVRDFAAVSAPADAVFIGLYDEVRRERTAAYASGDGEEVDVSMLPPMPLGGGPNSEAIVSGQPVISDDYQARMQGNAQVVIDTAQRDKLPRSSLAVPMVVMNRVVGTIEVQSYMPAAYRQEHATALALAANLAAVAIENVSLLERETQARGQAERSNRLKDEFLATVSHELRTPLNAMLGWIHMLRGGGLDQRMSRRAIDTIARNAKAQAQLVEDILDVSRIITGKLRVTVADIDLAGVIASAVDAVHIAADAKGIAIDTYVDRTASHVVGDPDRLQQVVWNLLSNAIKFTPRGGSVMVRLDRDGDQAAIVVSDTGEGIDSDFLPFVFDRFSQADSSPRRSHGGLGLGLAIVRHIAEMHGGWVTASSPGEGAGSTFIVRLPLSLEAIADPSTSPLVPARTSDLGLETGAILHGLRILLVDDEPDSLEVLSLVLEQRGGDVRATTTAKEALEALDHWAPDVIVSDLGMPETDGFELLSSIRSLPAEKGGAAPAIALTAYTRDEDREKAEQCGFQLHLSKPLDPEAVVAAVADLVATHGLRD